MPEQTVEQLITIAVGHHQAGRVQQAAALYQQALAREPQNPNAMHLLGVTALQLGQPGKAIELIRRAIAINASIADYHSNLANALKAIGQLDGAIDSYREALRLRPASPDTHNNLGNAWIAKGQIDRAIAAYREALRLKPDYPDAHNNLGSALMDNGKLDGAISSFREALRQRAAYPAAWNNLGNALRARGQLDEAFDAHRHALRHKSDFAEAHNSLGLDYEEQGQPAKAIESYQQAIRFKPDLADAHCNMAMSLLLHGDFERGWPEYEWRWQVKGAPLPQHNFVQPRWTGEDFSGRTLLLYAEQGFGDTIQFIRYAPRVARLGGKVIFVCMPGVERLLQNAPGIDEMVAPGTLPPFHLQCPLMSLPLVFNTKVDSIPAAVPYLKPDACLAEHWRKKLQGAAGRLKVGLAWAGRPTHRDDHKRSIHFSQLAPLARAGNVSFYSLQKGDAAAQIASLPGMNLIDFTPDLHDFSDTAALISELDLIITVDTAIAHLAGAMAKPVWVLLPHKPDWRWLLHREDSPWYPTLRLFRQSAKREWGEVIDRVAQCLEAIARAAG